MFLQLRPEVSRLRRMVKACAAGEVSRRKYRQARREVIQHLQGQFDSVDLTLRRPEGVSVGAVHNGRDEQTFGAEPDAHGMSDALRSGVERAGRFKRSILGAALLLCILLPFFAMGQTVPPLAERDPNPTRSQRLQVSEVRWQKPDLLGDITAAEIEAFLARELKSKQDLNNLADHGFTADELEQVGRFLNAVGVHDNNTSLTRQDMQDLAALIDAQKQRRGVSLLQVEQIAAALETWLHAAGYPVAAAYVPAQQIEEGLVHVAVELGVLSDVAVTVAESVRGQPLLGSQTESPYGLDNLVGSVVRRSEIESRLNFLNQSAQRSVQAGFRPGHSVGESQMLLQIDDVRRVGAFVQADNHGTQNLGEERLSVGVHAADLLFAGDSIAFALSRSASAGDQVFGVLDYEMPLVPGLRNVQTRIGLTDVHVGSGVNGEGWQAQILLEETRLFTRASRRQYYYGIGIHEVDFQVRTQPSAEEQTTYVTAGLRGHQLWDPQRIALEGEIQLVAGHSDPFTVAGTPGRGENFWLLKSEATAWTPVTLPLTWAGLGEVHSRAVFRARMQAGSDHVPTTFKFNAALPGYGSGLPAGSLQLDGAVGVNAALRMQAPVGDYWVYSDFVYGEQDATDEYFHLTTLGLGWEAGLKGLWDDADTLSSRVTLGFPVSHKSNGEFEDEGIQLFWSLRYRY